MAAAKRWITETRETDTANTSSDCLFSAAVKATRWVGARFCGCSVGLYKQTQMRSAAVTFLKPASKQLGGTPDEKYRRILQLHRRRFPPLTSVSNWLHQLAVNTRRFLPYGARTDRKFKTEKG